MDQGISPSPAFSSASVSALVERLDRIAAALDRLAPPPPPPLDPSGAEAFNWSPAQRQLVPVPKVARVDLDLLRGVDRVRDILLDNTRRFARGFPANNALLWGARGMGKSSLVKAAHAAIAAECTADGTGEGALKLIEIHREDIATLPELIGALRSVPARFLLFCDDLSFDHDDATYKSLKAVLDGGIEGRPENTLLYATSNRRHLMPRDMMENERSTAINPAEAVEEKVSLSDRFGLWLGFHGCDQPTYLAMIHGYAGRYGLAIEPADLDRKAIEWAATRGARSGRVAWQFVQDVAGRLGRRLDP